jgi:predicted metal-binding membrane protein
MTTVARTTANTRRSTGGVHSPGINEQPPTRLEAALGHERVALLVLLVLVPLVCWSWIVFMAHDMYGRMTGASAWMMTLHWDAAHLFLLWAMWAVMMAAMMLPSASPLLLLYGASARRRSESTRAARDTYFLAAGYVAVWAGFSVGATIAQRFLSTFLILSPMMTVTRPSYGAVLLVVAGLYQLTPLKRVCLHKCRSPLSFLIHRWRPGSLGAFRMGVDHGAYCLGCCWALMLLLFVGGVMNLVVIGALTAVVAFEKVARFGSYSARVSGAMLIAAGSWILFRGM